MASSTPAPPPLPITTSQATQNSASSPSQNAPSPPYRLFLARITDSFRSSALSQRRPWSEVVDRSAFSRPDSISEATGRIRKNAAYFRVNYAMVVVSVLALSLVSNPGSLALLLLLSAAWSFLYLFRSSDSPPLVLFGRTFTDRESLGLLLAISFFVFFLTSVGSVIISALLFGLAIVATHAAIRMPEDLFLDEPDSSASVGFLSFIGGNSTPAPAVTVPTPARV